MVQLLTGQALPVSACAAGVQSPAEDQHEHVQNKTQAVLRQISARGALHGGAAGICLTGGCKIFALAL